MATECCKTLIYKNVYHSSSHGNHVFKVNEWTNNVTYMYVPNMFMLYSDLSQ